MNIKNLLPAMVHDPRKGVAFVFGRRTPKAGFLFYPKPKTSIMITKTINTNRHTESGLSVTLSYFDCYEDIERLKKSLLFCVKLAVLSKESSGEVPQLWDVCALIEDLSLSDQQAIKVDGFLFP